jgi:hypothetical protein
MYIEYIVRNSKRYILFITKIIIVEHFFILLV